MVGIIAVKTKRTQIHFLSDVLVAVALLDLRKPRTARKEQESERTDLQWSNNQNFLVIGFSK